MKIGSRFEQWSSMPGSGVITTCCTVDKSTRVPCSLTDLNIELIEIIRDLLPKSWWANARLVCKEWRQVFSKGLRKATLTKNGAQCMRLHRDSRVEGQQIDEFSWFWVNALTSLARSFIHITELDLQDWTLVSSQHSLPANVYNYVTLGALTLALPAMPALRTLRLSHHVTTSWPLAVLLQDELPQAMEGWPALSLHFNLTLPTLKCPGCEKLASSVSLGLQALGRQSSLAGLAINARVRWSPLGEGPGLVRGIGAMTALESLCVDLYLVNGNLFGSELECWSALTRLSHLSLKAPYGFQSTACAALRLLLSRLPRLQDLRLWASERSADRATLMEGVVAATGLTRLALLLEDGLVRDASLEKLSRLRSLADLSLYRNRLTGEFMASIAPVAPLTRLALMKPYYLFSDRNDVTPAGLEAITLATGLQRLILQAACRLPGRCMKCLTRLTRLTRLHCAGTHLVSQVDVFKEMVSLRALYLEPVRWRRRRRGRRNIGALLSRLLPLTNLEELSLTVSDGAPDLADYAELCSFWQHSSSLMAQDMCSLRWVEVATPWAKELTTFDVR